MAENVSEDAEMSAQGSSTKEYGAGEVTGEICPVCQQKTLTLREKEHDVPYFGKVYLFSMTCDSCKFHQADVECVEEKEPVRCSVEVSGEQDMSIKIVKSSNATVKIPHVATMEPGPASNGYITNVEGLLRRVMSQIETLRDSEEDEEAVQKAKSLLKKLNRVIWGSESVKIIIEDTTGNSTILSEKAVVEKLPVKAKKVYE